MKTTRMRIMASLILGLFIVFSGVMASCSSTTGTYTTPTSGTTQYQTVNMDIQLMFFRNGP